MLRQKLQEDLTYALKTGDRPRLETLRFVMSRIKNQEIEKKGELTDEETITVIQKIKRELGESIEAFEKGGRADLVEQNKAQATILSSYLPQEMSDSELAQALKKMKAENAQAYEANPKALIGIAIRELKGKADSQRIVKVLQSLE